jgi:hypothetical protein
MGLNKQVKNERRRVLRVGAVATGLGVIILFTVGALIGLPWFVAAIASVAYVFVMLIVEAEAEDKVLVKAYGPSKKEAWTGRAGEE